MLNPEDNFDMLSMSGNAGEKTAKDFAKDYTKLVESTKRKHTFKTFWDKFIGDIDIKSPNVNVKYSPGTGINIETDKTKVSTVPSANQTSYYGQMSPGVNLEKILTVGGVALVLFLLFNYAKDK